MKTMKLNDLYGTLLAELGGPTTESYHKKWITSRLNYIDS